ncbi:glutamate-5-semialdehyde dehydrogenase, partial [bacterium]|nr:glutamate-5-semialdehyde dehydrogenase [bacterium]
MANLDLPVIENVDQYIKEIATSAKTAGHVIASASTAAKNQALLEAARRIRATKGDIQAQNKLDLEAGREKGLSSAMLDRLELNDKRIEGMAVMLEEVAALPDPVGEITDMRIRPSGIQVGKMRVPLGVVGMIYESRPNVTVDAAALCLKSGNGCLLRGGSEAIHSNVALARLLQATLHDCGLPKEAVTFVETTDRAAVQTMCKLQGKLDVIIPRGGKALIEAVVEAATIPVLKHYDGNCHVYVHEDAEIDMALDICINSKTQRTGVCNAAESFIVHQGIASEFMPRLLAEMTQHGVEVRGCEKTRGFDSSIKAATDDDWYAEYLDKIVAIKIVDSFDDAVDHIETYGSRHTDAIVTNSFSMARRFIREVDSSSVMVNASTRFSDGGEYGLGAEMGISTDKLHARGPMGIVELTCQKFIVFGDGA